LQTDAVLQARVEDFKVILPRWLRDVGELVEKRQFEIGSMIMFGCDLLDFGKSSFPPVRIMTKIA
jgi:hypothetical protein